MEIIAWEKFQMTCLLRKSWSIQKLVMCSCRHFLLKGSLPTRSIYFSSWSKLAMDSKLAFVHCWFIWFSPKSGVNAATELCWAFRKAIKVVYRFWYCSWTGAMNWLSRGWVPLPPTLLRVISLHYNCWHIGTTSHLPTKGVWLKFELPLPTCRW